MFKKGALLGLTTAAAAALVATAGAGAGTSTRRGTEAAPPGVAAKVARGKATPKLHLGPKIDISSLAGKTFYVIPFASTSQFNQLEEQGTVTAAKLAGVKLKLYTTSGVPSQWQVALQRAVAEKAAGIILEGPVPELLAPQIKQAIKAGIPVVTSHSSDITVESTVKKAVPGLVFGARGPFSAAIRLAADYVILKSQGKANIAYVTPDDMGPTIAVMVKAFENEVKTNCPGCSLVRVSTSFAKAATQTPTAVQSALRQHPEINWVVPLLDNPFSQLVISALRQVGAENKVKIATYNGTTSILKLIGHGPVAADVGEPIPLMGMLSLDQVMRLALKKAPVTEPSLMRLFDASNVGQAGNPPTPTGGYGDSKAWLSQFAAAWGK